MYHADGVKESVIYGAEGDKVSSSGKDQILLDRQFDATQDLFAGAFSSILASLLGFLPSLDHPVRSRQQIGWNRQADLLGGF